MITITPQRSSSKLIALKLRNAAPLNIIRDIKRPLKDVFTQTSFNEMKLPLEEINKMGEKFLDKLKSKDLDGFEAGDVLTKYVQDLNNFIVKSFAKTINSNKDFVRDLSHELTGSYVMKQQLRLFDVEDLPPAKVKEEIEDSFKLVKNHVDKTCKMYQFFLNHGFDDESKTVGINKVFDLMLKNFEHQAKDKNIKLKIRGKSLLSKYSQTSLSDYKNYVITSNLLGNAIKYSPDNSVIKMKFSVKDNCLNFIIKDEGIGIPIADQEGVLKQQRASNVGNVSGTGYGLYRTSKLLSDDGFGAIKITSPLYPKAEFRGTMIEAPLLTKIEDQSSFLDKITDSIKKNFSLK